MKFKLQKTPHKKSPHALYHVKIVVGVRKATNPLKMHFIVNSFKVHLNVFLILRPG